MTLIGHIQRAQAQLRQPRQELEEPMDDIPIVPEPLDKISGYTIQRLQASLRLVDYVLQHPKIKLTPIAELCATFYRATLKMVINQQDDNDDEKSRLLLEIIAFEKCLLGTESQVGPEDINERKLAKRILRLRRYKHVCRYGDAIKPFVDMKPDASRKPTNAEVFTHLYTWDGYCMTLSDKIREEQEFWVNCDYTYWSGNCCPITHEMMALRDACHRSKLDFQLTVREILMYADRGSVLHMPVERLAKQVESEVLAEMMVDDSEECLSAWRGHKVPQIRGAIEEAIDRYFDRGRFTSPLFLFAWKPRKNACTEEE